MTLATDLPCELGAAFSLALGFTRSSVQQSSHGTIPQLCSCSSHHSQAPRLVQPGLGEGWGDDKAYWPRASPIHTFKQSLRVKFVVGLGIK